jgi:hypothetical protein
VAFWPVSRSSVTGNCFFAARAATRGHHQAGHPAPPHPPRARGGGGGHQAPGRGLELAALRSSAPPELGALRSLLRSSAGPARPRAKTKDLERPARVPVHKALETKRRRSAS